MVQISKEEALMLNSKGFRWGSDLHHTYSGHNKYYATESPKILKVLRPYRESKVIATYAK